jgi:hypothetical protein
MYGVLRTVTNLCTKKHIRAMGSNVRPVEISAIKIVC